MATHILQRRDITDRTRSRSTLGEIDYSDVATIATNVEASPEQWARAIVEGAAGNAAQVFWRAIGLRLKGPSAGHIGGWRIASEGDDWIVCETSSFYATINAVCEVGDGGVSLTLLARFDHPVARLVCPPITLVHRRGIGLLLRKAVRNLGGKS
jgi:hypothetical protein